MREYTSICTYINIYMYVCIHTYIHTHIHACIQTYMHTCIYIHTHTCICYIHRWITIHPTRAEASSATWIGVFFLTSLMLTSAPRVVAPHGGVPCQRIHGSGFAHSDATSKKASSARVEESGWEFYPTQEDGKTPSTSSLAAATWSAVLHV